MCTVTWVRNAQRMYKQNDFTNTMAAVGNRLMASIHLYAWFKTRNNYEF